MELPEQGLGLATWNGVDPRRSQGLNYVWPPRHKKPCGRGACERAAAVLPGNPMQSASLIIR